MNKKPGLLFSVIVFTIIVVAAAFHVNLGGDSMVHLREGVNPDMVLYVCLAENSTWNQVAQGLRLVARYAPLFFSFAGVVLLFSWGWALYQNLLKDKFSDDVYKNPWELTKIVFWVMIVFSVIYMTPNHFRRVEIHGDDRAWVLCDNNSVDARAVPYKRVSLY